MPRHPVTWLVLVATATEFPSQLSIGVERPCLGALALRLSMVIVSTPFLDEALIESWLAPSGRLGALWKLP